MKKYAILATLMLLAIGLGSFQYWAVGQQSTASATIGDVPDRVSITAETPTLVSHPSPWRPFRVGNDSTYLYKIGVPASYNGNYVATLYLTNADDLADDYIYLMMQVDYMKSGGTWANVDKLLTLENGRVQFEIPNNAFTSGSVKIYIKDGVGNVPFWKKGQSVDDPSFLLELEEIGS